MGILNPSTINHQQANAGEQASRQLESLVIKQMLQASGVFRGTETAGSAINADLFAEALAEAVANSGGIGLASQLANAAAPRPNPTPTPIPLPQAAPSSGTATSAASSEDPLTLVNHGRVTSRYGVRSDPLNGHPSMHTGVDVAAAAGTTILAAADGVVRSAGLRGGYGFAVEIDHGGQVSTLYGHAQELLVHQGEHVLKGQPVAKVGETGRATGPHLHFEVRVNEHPVNPNLLPALKAYATCDDGKVGR